MADFAADQAASYRIMVRCNNGVVFAAQDARKNAGLRYQERVSVVFLPKQLPQTQSFQIQLSVG